MIIEKRISLRRAGLLAGIDRKTLKRWLQEELGITFPRVRHGSKLLVRERDVETVLARRNDVRNVPDPPRRKRRGSLQSA